jgi:peptide/nickel transport system substrate-binding protein
MIGNPRGRVLLLAAALISAPLLTACSSSSSGQETGQAPQSLTFALSSLPTSLDFTKDLLGEQIDPLVTETLETVGVRNALTPNLASSVAIPDNTTIIYHIRSGVHFSNGHPLTVQDVAWSISRTFNAKAGAATASNLTGIRSVSVTGADQVTVRLADGTPVAAARAIIDFYTLIQDATYARAHPANFGSPAAVPVGTGPYRVVSDTTDGITLQRRSNYWGPKPPVQTIKFVTITQDSTAQLAMRSGSLQGALIGNPGTTPQWEAVPGAKVLSLLDSNSTFISMDVKTAPFNDTHVRKAISYAIDRSGLVSAIYRGRASLLQGLVPANAVADVAPSPAAAQQLLNGLPSYHFNLAKAKSELAQSAYPHGFAMTLPYPSGQSWAELTALSMQHTLRSIGITINLHPLTESAYVTQLLAHKNLGVQILQFGTIPWDPDSGLALLVGKANAIANGFNTANFYPPGVQQAWAQVTTSSDNSVRWRGVKTILTQIGLELPYIPLYNTPYLVVLSGGFTFAGSPSWTDMYDGRWVFLLR